MSDIKAILKPERILLNSDARSKKRVLEQVSELCAATDEMELFYHLLINREKLGSTALGEGVALPHCRVPTLQKTIACFIRLQTAIDFHAPDEQKVDLVFGLLVPEAAHNEHLEILAQVAGLLSQEKIRTQIRGAQ
ncbi:MAG: PTS sugar transporter subunit IIA, partial [Gammaproteobacteria bacterium]